MTLNIDHLRKILNPHGEKHLLLACSGGLDSTVLAHVFGILELNFSLVHVNYKLRGLESDLDQDHVEQLAKQLGVMCHFLVEDISNSDQNIQLTARNVRYTFFKKIQESIPNSVLCTAHHLDDQIETFFINLLRGTGVKGLSGISESEGLLRPLLSYNKAQIHQYALANELKWREDASNQQATYLRNKIRIELLPVLAKIEANFRSNFSQNFEHLKRDSSIVEIHRAHVLNGVRTEKNEIKRYNIQKIEALTPFETLLDLIFRPEGFSHVQDLKQLLKSEGGKFIENDQKDQLLLKSGQSLYQLSNRVNPNLFSINSLFSITKVKKEDVTYTDNSCIYVDKEMLKGDFNLQPLSALHYFYPLGMTKKKKVSKFLKDIGIQGPLKMYIPLLFDGDELLWVVPFRMDHRNRITSKTKNILRIECLEKDFLEFFSS
ncbi:MAG: tRNA lysidine(34) synthetase TilS [Flavobacteriaceae bacterium]|nr:tRNA lysidine(34) synthetase TilS [Flavobacteriaceae bacterium]